MNPPPFEKPLGTPSHQNISVRRTPSFILVLVLRFETISSLPQFRLVGTRWSNCPPFQKLLVNLLHENFGVRRAFPFIVVLVLWFETISSLPQFHLVGTRWNPPLRVPKDPFAFENARKTSLIKYNSTDPSF